MLDRKVLYLVANKCKHIIKSVQGLVLPFLEDGDDLKYLALYYVLIIVHHSTNPPQLTGWISTAL